MSVQTQIDRISGNVTAALEAIAAKGVTVPGGSGSDDLATLIAAIEAGNGGGGVSLPTGYVMECGIYIPAENNTRGGIVYTDNNFKWKTKDKNGVSFAAFCGLDIPANTASIAASVTFCNKQLKIEGRSWGVSESNTYISLGMNCGFSTNDKSNRFNIPANSSYPLLAGASYFYIAVAEVVV